ncbi:uncharacterized protein [Solanum lycopersicum]|uniref:Uncharacterized protein n=1 Tax=Solanum lycopersicum TaxID=4081 RepID=A0A3Q7I953_SOLLC|nr:uncharacterized protein LOC101257706 [Solanum lycopersicum]
MNYHSRRILTLDESSRKRKDRDTFYSSPRPSNPLTSVSNANLTTSFPKPDPKKKGHPPHQMPNSVLAGYMAYEYLTKGTLLGQKFDPARPRANAAATPVADPKKRKSSPDEPKPSQNYVEISSLLRSDGTHIPGIVNPTQLGQWIQM